MAHRLFYVTLCVLYDPAQSQSISHTSYWRGIQSKKVETSNIQPFLGWGQGVLIRSLIDLLIRLDHGVMYFGPPEKAEETWRNFLMKKIENPDSQNDGLFLSKWAHWRTTLRLVDNRENGLFIGLLLWVGFFSWVYWRIVTLAIYQWMTMDIESWGIIATWLLFLFNCLELWISYISEESCIGWSKKHVKYVYKFRMLLQETSAWIRRPLW